MGRKKLISNDDLLNAARHVFTTQGLTASTRAVARQAGTSEAVLFQRYPTKADLFFAAMSPPAFDLDQAAPLTSSEPPEQTVRNLFLALLEYFRAASPVFIQLLATRNFEFEDFARNHPNNSLATLRWAVTERLGALKSIGGMSADPRWAALLLFSTAQGLAIFERLGAHGGRFQEVMVNGTAAAIWSGLKPEAKP